MSRKTFLDNYNAKYFDFIREASSNMSKKEGKDSYAVIVISKLLRIIDLEMIEDLQEAESTKNVSRNLEIAGNLASRKGKNFFSKSSDRINKILHKSGKLSTALLCTKYDAVALQLHA